MTLSSKADIVFTKGKIYKDNDFAFQCISRNGDYVTFVNVGNNQVFRKKVKVTYIRGKSYEEFQLRNSHGVHFACVTSSGILPEYVELTIQRAKEYYEYRAQQEENEQPAQEDTPQQEQTTTAITAQPLPKDNESEHSLTRAFVGKSLEQIKDRLSHDTVKSLRAFATFLIIPYCARMRKQQLIDAISDRVYYLLNANEDSIIETVSGPEGYNSQQEDFSPEPVKPRSIPDLPAHFPSCEKAKIKFEVGAVYEAQDTGRSHYPIEIISRNAHSITIKFTYTIGGLLADTVDIKIEGFTEKAICHTTNYRPMFLSADKKYHNAPAITEHDSLPEDTASTPEAFFDDDYYSDNGGDNSHPQQEIPADHEPDTHTEPITPEIVFDAPAQDNSRAIVPVDTFRKSLRFVALFIRLWWAAHLRSLGAIIIPAPILEQHKLPLEPIRFQLGLSYTVFKYGDPIGTARIIAFNDDFRKRKRGTPPLDLRRLFFKVESGLSCKYLVMYPTVENNAEICYENSNGYEICAHILAENYMPQQISENSPQKSFRTGYEYTLYLGDNTKSTATIIARDEASITFISGNNICRDNKKFSAITAPILVDTVNMNEYISFANTSCYADEELCSSVIKGSYTPIEFRHSRDYWHVMPICHQDWTNEYDSYRKLRNQEYRQQEQQAQPQKQPQMQTSTPSQEQQHGIDWYSVIRENPDKIISYDFSDFLNDDSHLTPKQQADMLDAVIAHNLAIVDNCPQPEEIKHILVNASEATLIGIMNHTKDYHGTCGAYYLVQGKEYSHEEMVDLLIERILFCRQDKAEWTRKKQQTENSTSVRLTSSTSKPQPTRKPRNTTSDENLDHSFIECKNLHGLECSDAMRHNRQLVKAFMFIEPLIAALLTLSKQTIIYLVNDFGCGFLIKGKKKPELVKAFAKELFRRRDYEQSHKPSQPVTPKPTTTTTATPKPEVKCDKKRQLYFSFEFDEEQSTQQKKVA